MRISPRDIAKALVETMESSPKLSVQEACDGALKMLRSRCPGVRTHELLRLVEREMRLRGHTSSALLVVPHEKSIKASEVAPLLLAKSGGKLFALERTTDPSLIGGAVLLVDHMRIDHSIKAALQTLLHICLQPLE